MQLTRFDPFVELEDIQQRLNRLFVTPFKGIEPAFTGFLPPVDIQETDAAFIVKTDLPEVKKEEIKIHLENGVLAIEGERRQEKEEQGRRFHKVERQYGHFVRRLALPTGLDAEKVDAEFKEGVLTITLPKAPTATRRVVDVKIG